MILYYDVNISFLISYFDVSNNTFHCVQYNTSNFMRNNPCLVLCKKQIKIQL